MKFRATVSIARVTFIEVIRDKALYNLFLIAVLLLGVAFAASSLTVLSPGRVILDFGLTAINLSCTLIAILNAASILIREIDRRTIHLALSRPISKTQFIIGKFLGLSWVLFVNLFLLGCMLTALYSSFGGSITSIYFLALFFIYLQSILVAAITLCFSTFTTTSLSVILGIGVYLLGNNVELLREMLAKNKNAWSPVVSNASHVLPNLNLFQLGFKVTYEFPIEFIFVVQVVFYAFFWVALMMVLGGQLLNRREGV